MYNRKNLYLIPIGNNLSMNRIHAAYHLVLVGH